MLDVFLHRETHTWPQDYAPDLTEWGTHWLRVADWRVDVHPTGVDVTPIESLNADASVLGRPGAVLLWLYNRGDDVQVSGDPERIAQVKRLLTTAMNVV